MYKRQVYGLVNVLFLITESLLIIVLSKDLMINVMHVVDRSRRKIKYLKDMRKECHVIFVLQKSAKRENLSLLSGKNR